jgi:hypothetical protein
VAPRSNHLWSSRSKLRSSRPDPTTRHNLPSRTWRAAPTDSARQTACNRMGGRTDKCRRAERGGREPRRPAPTRQQHRRRITMRSQTFRATWRKFVPLLLPLAALFLAGCHC